jgi:hypothetical protein
VITVQEIVQLHIIAGTALRKHGGNIELALREFMFAAADVGLPPDPEDIPQMLASLEFAARKYSLHSRRRQSDDNEHGPPRSDVHRGRVLTTIKPLGEILMDRRFGEGTAQLLTVCCASAFGNAEQLDCFCCLQPWTPDRALESVGIAEFVERPDAHATHSLMFGVCWDCSWDRPAVLAALKRDFGDFAAISNAPGTA